MLNIQINDITGNFPHWEFVSLVLGCVFLAVSVLLFLIFLRNIRKSLFSYRPVVQLGVSVFLLVLAVFLIRYFLKFGDSGTFFLFTANLAFSGVEFITLTLPVFALLAVLLIISNVVLVKREGFYPGNLLAVAAGIFFLGALAFVLALTYFDNIPVSGSFCNICYVLVCYFECQFTAVVVCSLLAGSHEPDYDKDYILILGCRIRDDGTLYPLVKGRADRALAFAEKQAGKTGKAPVFVPSGGKGSDETVSEGEAIASYLISAGIPESRILVENASATTRENMLFSSRLIGRPDARVAFSTTSFHVLRSGMIAAENGLNYDGMGSPTRWYFWPNAFVREFAALLVSSLPYQLVTAILLSAASGVLAYLI